MKLISLNTFGGSFFEPLMDFVRSHAADTDVFCFQEVLATTGSQILTSNKRRANLLAEFQKALPDFQDFFTSTADNYDHISTIQDPISTGIAMFVHKKHAIQKSSNFFIYLERGAFDGEDFATMPHNAQYVQLDVGDQLVTICNAHGTAVPGNKLDTPHRLAQSQKILDVMSQQPGHTVVAGDFNLLPHTQSIAMFEQHGFRNLIKDFSISTTRGSLHRQLHPEYADTPEGFQAYADYAFVTPSISIASFVVPDLPLSDHLPMILDFSV